MSEPAVSEPAVSELAAEDAKLVTLARSVRARTGAPEGAAVRDDTGRTYVAVSVALPSLTLSAVQAAVAAAVAGGARSLEAAAVVVDGALPGSALPEADVPEADLTLIHELGGPHGPARGRTPVFLAGPDGTVRAVRLAGRPAERS